jgi:DNA polymerase III epsilon subunit-like protein
MPKASEHETTSRQCQIRNSLPRLTPSLHFSDPKAHLKGGDDAVADAAPPKTAPAPIPPAHSTDEPPLNLVILDLETTGFTPERHEIIQIAAARLDANGCIADTFSTYVRPNTSLRPHITGLTGIRSRDVAHAPAVPDALRALAHFIEAHPEKGPPILVAHNGQRFDLRFITIACDRHSLHMRPIRYIDSLWLARKLWPAEPLHNLDTILERLGIKSNKSLYARHDARTDVRLLATAVLYMVIELFPTPMAQHLPAEAREHYFLAIT